MSRITKTHFRIKRSYRAPNLNSPDSEKFKRKVPIYDWDKININRPIKEIIQETGCCYGTIYKLQRRKGIKFKKDGKPLGRGFWKTVDFSKRNAQIAREAGCTEATVYAWRKRLGKRLPKRAAIDWDKIDFNKPVAQICNELNCSLSTVFRRKRATKAKVVSHIR